MHTKRNLSISTRSNWAARAFVLSHDHCFAVWATNKCSQLDHLDISSSFANFCNICFVPNTLTIDYDRDLIESRIWRLFSYDIQSRRRLRNIKLIQLEAQTGGDGPSYYHKYVIFQDGSKFQLPAINNIEMIIAEWYERNLGIEVTIKQDREIKRASNRAELILVIAFGCAILVFLFGESVWNQRFAETGFDEQKVVCQENNCVVTFRVINRTDVDRSQEFYVGVWSKLESESNTRPKGEIGFSRILVNLKPHETIYVPVHIKLYRSRLPGGEYALVQKV